MRRSNSACDSSTVCRSNIFSKGLLPAGGQSARSRLTDQPRPRQLRTAQPVFVSAVDYDAKTHMDAWGGRIADDWPALVLRQRQTERSSRLKRFSAIHLNTTCSATIFSTAFWLRGAGCNLPSPHSAMVLVRHGLSSQSLCPI